MALSLRGEWKMTQRLDYVDAAPNGIRALGGVYG
jgi:hypothetical protein